MSRPIDGDEDGRLLSRSRSGRGGTALGRGEPVDGHSGSYRHAARQAVGLSVAPYGYTLTIWTSGAVLTHARGVPTTVDALLFMAGAVVGFALVGVATLGSLRARVGVEAQHRALWAGFHLPSIAAAIGTTSLIAHLLEDRGAWPLGGFAVTTIYLVMLAAQLAFAS